jgi:hypothetical protein
MNIFVFMFSAALSLPKQFVTVYIGVILEQASESGASTPLTTRLQEYAVVGVTTLVTLIAMWYILLRASRVKPAVIYARRKRRQAKLGASDSTSSLTALDPEAYGGPLGDAPLEPRAPAPRRAQEPSFDAYSGYGGRPPLPPPAQSWPAPSAAPPAGARPAPTRSATVSVSPGQTPTQAQFEFARGPAPPADGALVSPPLPTPTYGAPASGQQYQVFAPPAGAPYAQQAYSQPAYGQPPMSAALPSHSPVSPGVYAQQPMTAGPTYGQQASYGGQQAGFGGQQTAFNSQQQPTFAGQQQPTYANQQQPAFGQRYISPHSSANATPHMSPHMSPVHTGAPAFGHARDETDATFYTAHAGEPSTTEGAPPLSASSAHSHNPYGGYMTPPADAVRTFSPPPTYHAM